MRNVSLEPATSDTFKNCNFSLEFSALWLGIHISVVYIQFVKLEIEYTLITY